MEQARKTFSGNRLLVLAVVAVLAVALGLWLSLASGPSAKTPKKNPVVVVIFDEFSTSYLLDSSGKEIDRSRFPNFHRLSTEGAWYPRNTTVADFTNRAVPAMLTGRAGPQRYADYRQHRQSIYTLLNKAGYRKIRNLEISSQICPPKFCRPPGPKFFDFRKGNQAPHEFGGRIIGSANQVERRNRWIKRLRGLRSGELAVGHFEVPHNPHRYLSNGQQYRRTVDHSYRDSKKWTVTGQSGLLETYEKRILFQVGFADRLLGRIINSIKKSGKWNETLLVVGGDHGFSLKPGLASREVVSGNRHEIGLTPLLIKYPNETVRGRQEAMSQTVDILPTITETLGLNRAYKMKGIPLSRVPDDREVEVKDKAGKTFRITRDSADQFLEGSGKARARQLGTGGLKSLGPLDDLIGTRAPRTSRPDKPELTIAGLATLRRKPEGGKRPALVEGFTTGAGAARQFPNNTRLLLALDGRFVSSAATYPVKNRKAFAFLVHQRYLGRGGLVRPQIFRVSPSGKKIRVF